MYYKDTNEPVVSGTNGANRTSRSNEHKRSPQVSSRENFMTRKPGSKKSHFPMWLMILLLVVIVLGGVLMVMKLRKPKLAVQQFGYKFY
jgi:cell division septal protein FtsQ